MVLWLSTVHALIVFRERRGNGASGVLSVEALSLAVRHGVGNLAHRVHGSRKRNAIESTCERGGWSNGGAHRRHHRVHGIVHSSCTT